MPDPDVETLVRECLSQVLKRQIDAGMPVERQDDGNWDSLRHVELIFMLEDRTGFRFTEEEITGIRNSNDIIHLVAGKHGS